MYHHPKADLSAAAAPASSSIHHQPMVMANPNQTLTHQSSKSSFGDSTPGTPGDNFNDSESDTGNGQDEQDGDIKRNKRRTGFIETLYSKLAITMDDENAQKGTNSLCVFIVMSNTPENEPAIGFAADGVSLEIRNTEDLSTIVLPKHFKHRNVSSFIRQLNNYGFRTIRT